MPPKKTKKAKSLDKADKTEEDTVSKLATMATEDTLADELTPEAAGANPSPSDLMQAIVCLQSSVDSKFTVISTKITAMQTTLSSISGKLNDIEESVNDHEARITELESLYSLLQKGQDLQHKKLDDLESRSRRQNIRILGIKEEAEKGRPLEFVSNLIPNLLGNENFPNKVIVDRAHRGPGPKPADRARSRPFIVRLHYYQTRELIVRLAAKKGPLQYDGAKVFIFPDLSQDVVARRKEFDKVRKRCRDADLRYGFLYPARFVVTLEGDTHTFNKPDEALKFLDEKLPVRNNN